MKGEFFIRPGTHSDEMEEFVGGRGALGVEKAGSPERSIAKIFRALATPI